MKKNSKYEHDDKEQSARFEETARRIEEDIGKKDFNRTCSKILQTKKPKQKGK